MHFLYVTQMVLTSDKWSSTYGSRVTRSSPQWQRCMLLFFSDIFKSNFSALHIALGLFKLWERCWSKQSATHASVCKDQSFQYLQDLPNSTNFEGQALGMSQVRVMVRYEVESKRARTEHINLGLNHFSTHTLHNLF